MCVFRSLQYDTRFLARIGETNSQLIVSPALQHRHNNYTQYNIHTKYKVIINSTYTLHHIYIRLATESLPPHFLTLWYILFQHQIPATIVPTLTTWHFSERTHEGIAGGYGRRKR